MNLAGVLPWTDWRGLSVLALLAAGKIFCLACPFKQRHCRFRRALRVTARADQQNEL